MTMTKDKLRQLYNQESQRLIGVLPSKEEVDDLYDCYLAGVDFTESEMDLLFEKDENGELDVAFKPHDVFPVSSPSQG